jgi:adenylate cyclase
MADDLRAFLRDAGATDDDIARAEREGWLPLLAVDRALMPGARRYDVAGIARAAGVDEEFTRRLWRALGFPDIPAGVEVFTDGDLEALNRLLARMTREDDRDAVLRQARVISAAMARVAAVEAGMIAEAIDALETDGYAPEATAGLLLEGLDWPNIEALVDYVHRLQLRAEVWRHLARETLTGGEVGVGFADLSGFTALSERLDAARLADLVGGWEALAYDTAAAYGARVVKTVGDEVMVVGLASDVARVLLALRDGVRVDPDLPELRAGLASGPVVARDGDYYGPVVNLASRITGIAHRDQVLTSAAVHELLAGEPDLVWRSAGTHHLHGIGDAEVWELDGAAAS